MISHLSWQWMAGGVGLIFSLQLWGWSSPGSPPAGQTATAASPDQAAHLLGPEDTIEISAWKEPHLTKQLVVRPDGKIAYPPIGAVQVAGRIRNERCCLLCELEAS
jgi:hypothetical protein